MRKFVLKQNKSGHYTYSCAELKRNHIIEFHAIEKFLNQNYNYVQPTRSK